MFSLPAEFHINKGPLYIKQCIYIDSLDRLSKKYANVLHYALLFGAHLYLVYLFH